MNVKPGDMAKIISDPHNQGVLGLLVLVVERAKGRNAEYLRQHYLCECWDIEILEARFIRGTFAGDMLFKAGAVLLAADCALKRIDPPADWQDLYLTTPIEGESYPHRHMEDLIHHQGT